jgi:hypothetical protein
MRPGELPVKNEFSFFCFCRVSADLVIKNSRDEMIFTIVSGGGSARCGAVSREKKRLH